jgi:hypothetical protein
MLGRLGQQRFLLRWPSLLFGALSVPLLGLVGYRLFRNKKDSFIVALLLCLSAFHIHWSQQFRGYSLLLFFALLSFFYLYLTLHTGRNRYWFYFLLAVSLAIASHLYGVLLLIVTVAMIGCSAGYHLATKRASLSQQKWLLISSAVALTLAGYFTWFAKIYIINPNHPPPNLSLLQLIRYQWLAFSPTLVDIQAFLADIALAYTAQTDESLALALFWSLAGAGLLCSWSRFPGLSLFLALWLTVPLLVVSLAELTIAGFFVFDRYLIFTLPAWLLLATRALTAGADRLAAWILSKRPDIPDIRGYHPHTWAYSRLAISAFLLLIGLAYLGLGNFKLARLYFAERAGHDWRAIAAYLATHVAATDLIVCKQLPHRWPPRRLDLGDQCTKELTYRLAGLELVPRFPIKQLEIIASLNTGLRFKNQANTPGAVWLVTWGENLPLLAMADNFPASSQPRPRGLAMQLTPPPAAVTFDRLGYAAVLKADVAPTLVANLSQALEHLARLDTASSDRFDYYLRQAQLLAYQGHLSAAQARLTRARQLPNTDAEALLETTAVIRAMAANFNRPISSPAHQLAIDFGRPPALRLAGYVLPATLQPGQTIPVTLFWQPLAPLSADYTIFLHLRNSAGETLAQLDFRPFDGAYPTYHWSPGVRITETRFWNMPAGLPPGAYTLYLGLYQLEQLTPLPLSDRQSAQNAARLGQVYISRYSPAFKEHPETNPRHARPPGLHF